MRFVLIALVTLFLFGCSEHQPGPFPSPSPSPIPAPPTPPPAPPPVTNGRILVVVLDRQGFGACAPRVTVEIVRGYGTGRSVGQSDHCSWWDPDFRTYFDNLIAGEEITLRASAPGFMSVEKAVLPSSANPVPVADIELSRIQ
jgi:hypothetical protein